MIQDDFDGDTEADAPDHGGETQMPAPTPKGSAKPRGRTGVVFSLFLLATLGGAAGGWGLSHYFPPKTIEASGPNIDLTPIEQRLARAEHVLDGQKAQLSRLSAEINSGAARVTLGAKPDKASPQSAVDVQPLIVRLERLEAAAALAASKSSAPESQSFASPETPDKTKAPSSADAPSASSSEPISAVDYAPDIEALAVRVAALEAEAEQTRAFVRTPTVIKDTVLLPPFPRSAVLAAMTSDTEAPQSWLNKTLKKHISVRDPEQVARANSALDEIEKNIKAGEHAKALKGVEALPSQARSEAKTWIEAVRREVKG